MKKIRLMAVAMLFISSAVMAQEIDFGVKAGVNFATVTGDTEEDLNSRTGLHIGVFAEIPLAEKFAIQPELLYSMQGAKDDGEELKLDYINVPVMAKYYVAEGLAIEAGPQFGFNVSANVDFDGDEQDVKEFVSGFDLGLGGGLSYNMDMGLVLQARYIFGVSNIWDEDDFGDLNNGVFSLSLGYKF